MLRLLLAVALAAAAPRSPSKPSRPPFAPQPPNFPAEPPSALADTAAWYEVLNFSALVTAVTLTSLPGTRKYVAHSTFTNGLAVGIIDLDTQKATRVAALFADHFCAAPLVLKDGRVVLVGGTRSRKAFAVDGRRAISVFNSSSGQMEPVAKMEFPRWYPTVLRLADDKVLIVGGTEAADRGPTAPEAELFDPAAPAGSALQRVAQPLPFTAAAGYNWFPFMALLPTGHILWWGDTAGCITDRLVGNSWSRIVRNLTLPPSFPYSTMYKSTASPSLLALKPSLVNHTPSYTTFSFVLFGGAPSTIQPNGSVGMPSRSVGASDLSARLDLYVCGKGKICDTGWQVERMPGRRVMPDSTVMPNGKVIVHGGGQRGGAGLWQMAQTNEHIAARPGGVAFVYDPDAPLGQRYRVTGSIKVVRLYHSTACLDITGSLLSAGCEQCAVPKPFGCTDSPTGDDYEYRLTMGHPHEISPPVERPQITAAPKTVLRGTTFTARYKYSGNITGAAMAAPCAATHSLNMGQRVIFLAIRSIARGKVSVHAPPALHPAVAPSGHYMLFLLGERNGNGTTYSEGAWLVLRGG